MLAMLVQLITVDQRASFSQYDHVEEFIDFFTMKETCAMLLQMVVNQSGVYTFSKRMQEGFKNAKRHHGDASLNQSGLLASKSQQFARK